MTYTINEILNKEPTLYKSYDGDDNLLSTKDIEKLDPELSNSALMEYGYIVDSNYVSEYVSNLGNLEQASVPLEVGDILAIKVPVGVEKIEVFSGSDLLYTIDYDEFNEKFYERVLLIKKALQDEDYNLLDTHLEAQVHRTSCISLYDVHKNYYLPQLLFKTYFYLNTAEFVQNTVIFDDFTKFYLGTSFTETQANLGIPSDQQTAFTSYDSGVNFPWNPTYTA